MRLFGPPNITRMRDNRDVRGLIEALSFKMGSVRQEAANALGKIGDVRAVEPLIGALKDGEKSVRLAATNALEMIVDARAVEPLIAALKDRDEWVRNKAAEALGKIGDVRAVEPLIAALKDRDQWVSLAAARALGEVGNAGFAKTHPDAVVRAVLSGIRGGSCSLDGRVIRLLGETRHPDALNSLLAALNEPRYDGTGGGPDGEFRTSSIQESAAEALGKLGNRKALQPLIVALQDSSRGPDTRKAIATALGALGDESASNALVNLILGGTKDGKVAGAAQSALSKIGGDVAKGFERLGPILVGLLGGSAASRAHAAEQLSALGDRRGLNHLRDAVRKLKHRLTLPMTTDFCVSTEDEYDYKRWREMEMALVIMEKALRELEPQE